MNGRAQEVGAPLQHRPGPAVRASVGRRHADVDVEDRRGLQSAEDFGTEKAGAAHDDQAGSPSCHNVHDDRHVDVGDAQRGHRGLCAYRIGRLSVCQLGQ